MMSGPIRKTHLLSRMPTPPCACAAEASRTMARSHAAIPRITILLNSHNISPAGASAPAGEITYLVYLLHPTRDNTSDRHEGRDHRSADFHRVARSTRREEEQNAGERTVDVIGQARKTFRIPPRVLDGDRDVLGLARRDGGIIAQRQAPVRQQIVRIFHLGGVDVRIQEAESGGVKFTDPQRLLAVVGDLEIGHQLAPRHLISSVHIFDCDRPRVYFIFHSLDVSEVTRLQRDGVWIIADRDRIEDDDHEQNREKRECADYALLWSNYLFRLSGSHPCKPADEAALAEPIEDPSATGDDPEEMPHIDLALPIVLDIDHGPIQQFHVIPVVGEIALDVDILTWAGNWAAG